MNIIGVREVRAIVYDDKKIYKPLDFRRKYIYLLDIMQKFTCANVYVYKGNIV